MKTVRHDEMRSMDAYKFTYPNRVRGRNVEKRNEEREKGNEIERNRAKRRHRVHRWWWDCMLYMGKIVKKLNSLHDSRVSLYADTFSWRMCKVSRFKYINTTYTQREDKLQSCDWMLLWWSEMKWMCWWWRDGERSRSARFRYSSDAIHTTFTDERKSEPSTNQSWWTSDKDIMVANKIHSHRMCMYVRESSTRERRSGCYPHEIFTRAKKALHQSQHQHWMNVFEQKAVALFCLVLFDHFFSISIRFVTIFRLHFSLFCHCFPYAVFCLIFQTPPLALWCCWLMISIFTEFSFAALRISDIVDQWQSGYDKRFNLANSDL